jgi:MerR family transcriptional regulator, light-induced transcriptional regulator
VESSDGPPVLRIGELSRRVGVSEHVLRAWESRYGLLQPGRSAGGFRLYSEADALRVRRMQAHLARGLSAAEAAGEVLGENSGARGDSGRSDSGRGDSGQTLGPDRVPLTVSELSGAFGRALDAFDEPAAQAALDRLLSDLSVPTTLREVVMPYLAELGDRWVRGTGSIGQEHFASNVIRGRLSGLARGWGSGHGPRAVLACPPGELHDIALMVFGIMLNRTGWRIDYLGANTPVEELTRTVEGSQPDLVVLVATQTPIFEGIAAQLTELARRAPLALAGAGATPQLAAAAHARLLDGDPVTAAEHVRWPR